MGGGARQQHGKRRGRLGPATLISLLVHLQVIALVGVIAYFEAPRVATPVAGNGEPIEITTLDEETSRQVAAALDKREEEERKKEEESPQTPGQVVDIPAPREETPPPQARFAAEHDSRVARETRRNG